MTAFNLQAALEALTAAQSLGGASAKQFAILRDLRERLAQGQEAWEAWGGVVVKVEPQNGVERPVLILDLSEKP